jgi:hypothetical protein
MRAITTVPTARPEVGVLVDAPSSQLAGLASNLESRGIHASFALDQSFSHTELSVLGPGDQAVPRLPTGGLVRWLQTRAQLHHLLHAMGVGRHFLYASSGPSVGQWWLAHRAGGRLIAGAVRLDDNGDSVGYLHPGEVIELRVANLDQALPLLDNLRSKLEADHLAAVPVGQLIRDAGSAA